MTSYLYYVLGISVISDELFDKICKTLLEGHDKLTHQHKHLVEREALEAGTAYHLKEADYPVRVKWAAMDVAVLAGYMRG